MPTTAETPFVIRNTIAQVLVQQCHSTSFLRHCHGRISPFLNPNILRIDHESFLIAEISGILVTEHLLARRFDVLDTRLLVFGAEELGTVAAEPGAELGELFFETCDGLLIHVGLSNDLGHVDCQRG